MAFEAVEMNGYPIHANNKQFLCTSVDDITKLPKLGIRGTQTDIRNPQDNDPVAIGSTAMVKTGQIYMLYPDNEWTEIQ